MQNGFCYQARIPAAPVPRPRRLARPRTPPFHGDNTGSNPVGDANKTKALEKNSRESWRPLASITGFCLFLSLPSNDHAHDPVMCLALEFRNSLRIDVHRDRAISMSQELLYGLHIFAVCFEQRGEGVTKRVPADLARNAGGFCRRRKMRPIQSARPIRLLT